MVKILLVEDEPEKRRLISETLLTVPSLKEADVEYAGDAITAKKRIGVQKFDLVILDIVIPPRPNEREAPAGGLEVLSFIRNNESAIAPTYIFGITAYDEGYSVAASEFASPLWKLSKFSYTDHSWKAPLIDAVSILIRRDVPPYPSDGQTYRTDLAIIVALEDVELASLKRLSGNWRSVRLSHDPQRYWEGHFKRDERSVRVIAAAAPKMGMPPAAVTATKMISSFRPKYLVMAGICAGIEGKTSIGDLLVADPCWDWGGGKWVRNDETKQLKFKPAPYPWRVDEWLRSSLKEVGEDTALIQAIHTSYPGPKPRVLPTVRIDAMASGASVIQVEELMADVKDQHKNLIGLEMESYAVMTAAAYAEAPQPKCFSVKSVCDFGTEAKNDEHHAYAASVSANFVYEFALRKLAS